MTINYTGGSKNAFARQQRQRQADVTGTPFHYRVQRAKSFGTHMKQQKYSSKRDGVSKKHHRPNIALALAHAPPLVKPQTPVEADREEDDDIAEWDEAALAKKKCTWKDLRDEYESNQRVARSKGLTELVAGASASRQSRQALLDVADWSELAPPRPSKRAPKQVKSALKPSSKHPIVLNSNTHGQTSGPFNLTGLVRPPARRDDSWSTAGAGFSSSSNWSAVPTSSHYGFYSPATQPSPPSTKRPQPQPRYRAHRARSPPTDEARGHGSLLPDEEATDVTVHELETLLDEDTGSSTRTCPPSSATDAPLEEPQADHDGSEPMDASSEHDENGDDLEILSFGDDRRNAPPVSNSLSQDLGTLPSSVVQAANGSLDSSRPPRSPPRADECPSASLEVAPSSPPTPSPPAPLYPDESYYLSTSSHAYWSVLSLSMTSSPLPSSALKPLRVGWTSVCCATKKQRGQLADLFIFEGVEQQGEKEGEDWVTHERMGLGCRGVRKENAGRLDEAMLNVGWDGWMGGEETEGGEDQLEEMADEEDLAAADPVKVEPLWQFALKPLVEMDEDFEVKSEVSEEKAEVQDVKTQAQEQQDLAHLALYTNSSSPSSPAAPPQTLTSLNDDASSQSPNPGESLDLTSLLLAVQLDSAKINVLGSPNSSPDPLAPKTAVRQDKQAMSSE